MMITDIIDRVRGYANPFNELSTPIGSSSDALYRAITLPGAFKNCLHKTIYADVMHSGNVRVATTWNRSLRIWQDTHGLAFELDVPTTPLGLGLRAMITSGADGCSVGYSILASTTTTEHLDGFPRHVVSHAEIDHLTIIDAGAWAGARCWLASAPPEGMTPDIAAAARRWHLGKIAHAKQRDADRDLVRRWDAGKIARLG
jgi:HK97 family phage prohead protease